MEYTGGQAIRRKFLQKGKRVPQLKLTQDNSVLVFPFSLTMGYITSTENGIRQNNSVNVYDYSTFQRIFTGLENVLAQWDGAYSVTKAKDTDTFLTKQYKTGNSFKAYLPKETLGATFEASAISGDFLAEFTQETFTIHTYEDIQETDLFKLFIIPSLKENKWLYITGADKYFLPNGKLHHVEITLESLNNRIAKSGKAIEEFVQRSAPGEGYAFPSVNGHNVALDEERAKDIPITSIQVEGAGAFAMGTIFAHGRPTINKTENGVIGSTFNPKIEPPRLLLAYKLETAIPSPVNTRPTAETDWLIGKFKPTLQEDFADWKDQLQANYDLTARAQYEGMLKSIDNDSVVNASNPINEGTRDNLLWSSNFSFSVDKIYNTATDQYTEEKLEIKKKITMPELLAHNVFGLSPFTSLPLSVEQNIAWSLKDIPLIGGFLSKLTFGIPIGWTNTAIKVKTDDLLLAIPASLRDYSNVLIKGTDKLRIDLNTFTDEVAKNEAIDFSGIKATGSIWKIQLTDRFIKVINGNEYIFNTVDLGQKGATGVNEIDDEKNYVYKNDETLYWDATCKPTVRAPGTPGFVIDTSTFKILGKMDIRTAFFSNNISVWTSTHQTTSKFTGSIRDWTNATKYSNWNEEKGKTINYPKNIVSPNPPNINNPIIKINDIIDKEATQTKFFIDNGRKFYEDSIKGKTVLPLSMDRNGQESDTKTYNFDTTEYGGINSFTNNYENIELSIENTFSAYETGYVKKGLTNTNVTIDLKTLLQNGKTTIKIIPPYFKNAQQFIGWADGVNDYNEQYDIKIQLNVKEFENTLNISITGNIISFKIANYIILNDPAPEAPDAKWKYFTIFEEIDGFTMSSMENHTKFVNAIANPVTIAPIKN